MNKELNGEKQGDRIIPTSEDNIKFWSDIWSIRKEHNQYDEWLKDCKKQFEIVNSMEKVEISQEMVKRNAERCLTRELPEKMVCKDIG